MGGVAQRTYLPGLGEAYPAGATPMADYAYYTPDHLGSVRGIRLPDRSLSGSYTYEPYGQTRAASGLPLNVGYTGHLWDATIQQYFAPFRYYNPAAARWTMRDPLGMVDGPNMYGYVGGNPIGFIDRDGRGKVGDLFRVCIDAVKSIYKGTKPAKDKTDGSTDASNANDAINNALGDANVLLNEAHMADDEDDLIEVLGKRVPTMNRNVKPLLDTTAKPIVFQLPGSEIVDIGDALKPDPKPNKPHQKPNDENDGCE